MSAQPMGADRYAAAEERIRGAIRDARGKGLRVRPGTPGVMRGEYTDAWCEDAGERGVNVFGAVLLGEATTQDDPHHAAAEVLDVSVAWLFGVSDGLDGDDETVGEIVWREAMRLYKPGFWFGRQIRREFFNGGTQ